MSKTKRLSGYRYVEIRPDDTLQALALRELGDADQWRALIAINDLTPPYLTGDLALSGPRVLLYGGQIIVPAATVQVSANLDPARVFGVDLALMSGRLAAEKGDFKLVSGRANLRQAILNRLGTAFRDLQFHPNYGCGVHDRVGRGSGPTAGQLCAQFVRSALRSDPRIDSVPSSVATVQGDVVLVDATARAINGVTVEFQTPV
jgi:phage baseplate assembly protein W